MINKERVQLLVQALRSGDYTQTTGALCRVADNGTKSYCCLGVACEIAIANGLPLTLSDNRDSRSPTIQFDGCGGYLPDSVRYWYGFDANNPLISVAAAEVNLGPCGCDSCRAKQAQVGAAAANDNYAATFEQIAAGFEAAYLTDQEVPA
jgi:hypothetical protein